MKITPLLRKQINAAVRANVRGAAPLAEVGYREVSDARERGCNALRWPADSDLWDVDRLANVKAIDDDPAHPGFHELDLYVTTGTGSARELETNVCVLIAHGWVVGATSEGREVLALKARVGFPVGPWDDPSSWSTVGEEARS